MWKKRHSARHMAKLHRQKSNTAVGKGTFTRNWCDKVNAHVKTCCSFLFSEILAMMPNVLLQLHCEREVPINFVVDLLRTCGKCMYIDFTADKAILKKKKWRYINFFQHMNARHNHAKYSTAVTSCEETQELKMGCIPYTHLENVTLCSVIWTRTVEAGR